MKRLILLFTLLPILSIAQQTYVPDDNFEAYLEGLGVGNGIIDDYVYTNLINSITFLDIQSEGISDLTGIEDFTALTHLYCNSNALTSLDVSNNINLTILYCQGCSLTSLNVTGAINLVGLYCTWNQLTSLDLSNNPNLAGLLCENNQLTCLNLKNGNNSNIFVQEFFTINNPFLSCIEVDNPTYSNANWTVANGNINNGVSFSTNCNYPAGCFSTTTIQENTNSINLYPNPTNNLITIDIEGNNKPFNVEVYDFTGRLLKTTNNTTISLKDYPKGIYMLNVAYGDKVEQVKVVRE